MAANSYGKRSADLREHFTPCIVDRLARDTPEAAFGVWPKDTGFYTITYSQLANVVNGLAWWLVEQIGVGKAQNGRRETLTYAGPNDLRYTAILLAAIKTGYGPHLLTALPILLTSPRNSAEAHRALFDRLNCKTLVTTDPAPPSVALVIEAAKPRTLISPGLETLINDKHREYPYDGSSATAINDPLFIIHTSGSTGIPKPMIWNQDAGARQQVSCRSKAPEDATSLDQFCHGKRVMITLPPFHGAGLSQYVFNAISFGTVPIVASSAPIPTAAAVVEALKQTPAEVLMLPPSLVAELAEAPELLDYCAKHLQLIIYIGGDLPQAIGDRVAAKILLRSEWGASEVGIPHQVMPHALGPADWRYVRFHPCVGAVFEEVTEGIYELVIRQHEASAETQPTWAIEGFDSLGAEYRTRDLFERHPTVPDAWQWIARADDIIVFLNGEKTNPVSMEQHVLASNPQLSGVIVIGSQRFQAALLIEPSKNEDPLSTAEQAALIEKVWTSVEEANRTAPAHARVEKSLILITTPDRPLIRAAKGTVQRPISIKQYTVEIDKLYANADVILDDDVVDVQVDPTDVKSVAQVIRACIGSVTDHPGLDQSENFFEQGMDSLQALRLARALRRTLCRPSLALSTIYQNPTVSALAQAIASEEAAPNDRDMMEPLLNTYTKLIHEIPAPAHTTATKGGPVDVILTGSTGQVGTYILHSLLNRSGVGHIFCLNRSEDGGRSVQQTRFAAAGLSTDKFAERVSFVQADLSQSNLGLDEATYTQLRTHAGLVIHNAWPVNFNLPLSAFRPQLAGLVNLFSLAAGASTPMRLLFVSSVGAVAGYASAEGPAPEKLLTSLDTPFAGGYARSKFLSEQLCEAAAQHLHLRSAAVRLGQVAGAVRGPSAWSRAEWLPSLVVSSLHMGAVPDSLGPLFSSVDFLPVDILGDVMVDLALADLADSQATFFNLCNPTATPWSELLPAVVKAGREQLGKDVAEVKAVEWIAKLEKDDGPADDAKNPAVKLVDFYKDALADRRDASRPMLFERALAASQALSAMPPVNQQWMHHWVEGWIGEDKAQGAK